MNVQEAINFLDSIKHSGNSFGNSYIGGEMYRVNGEGIYFNNIREIKKLIISLEAQKAQLVFENMQLCNENKELWLGKGGKL